MTPEFIAEMNALTDEISAQFPDASDEFHLAVFETVRIMATKYAKGELPPARVLH